MVWIDSYVRGIDFTSVATIFRMDFGIVLMVSHLDFFKICNGSCSKIVAFK